MYYKVPMIDGRVDAHYPDLTVFSISDDYARIVVKPGVPVRPSWIEIEALEFVCAMGGALVRLVNTDSIVADGVDSATISVTVTPGITSVVITDGQGEELCTLPIDPNTNSALFELATDISGDHVLRVGPELMMDAKLNEVMVRARSS